MISGISHVNAQHNLLFVLRKRIINVTRTTVCIWKYSHSISSSILQEKYWIFISATVPTSRYDIIPWNHKKDKPVCKYKCQSPCLSNLKNCRTKSSSYFSHITCQSYESSSESLEKNRFTFCYTTVSLAGVCIKVSRGQGPPILCLRHLLTLRTYYVTHFTLTLWLSLFI